jgi:hypothetical protein
VGVVEQRVVLADERQLVRDVAGGDQGGQVVPWWTAEDAVYDCVDVARHPGPHLAWAQEPPVLGGSRGQGRVARAGPAGHEAGVEHPSDRLNVAQLGRILQRRARVGPRAAGSRRAARDRRTARQVSAGQLL